MITCWEFHKLTLISIQWSISLVQLLELVHISYNNHLKKSVKMSYSTNEYSLSTQCEYMSMDSTILKIFSLLYFQLLCSDT
jgi:hypothetical protein